MVRVRHPRAMGSGVEFDCRFQLVAAAGKVSVGFEK
jgi:hypothetical protein